MRGMLNTAQCAERIGLQPSTLKSYRSRGLGPAPTKIVGKVWYSEASIEQWLAENTE